MENIKEEIKRKLYSEFSFIEPNSEKFVEIIFEGNTSGDYSDLYLNAIENIKKIMYKRIIKESSICPMFFELGKRLNINKTFDFFNNLIKEYNYDVSDKDIEDISDCREYKKFFDNITTLHKDEITAGNSKFIKNSLLSKVIENYYLSIVEDENDEEFESLGSALTEYLKSIGKIPLLSQEEELKYAKLAFEGDDEAKNILVEHNLRLVVKLAKKYAGKKHDLTLLDLIQEGNTGLIKSADKFDYRKGFKFSTYATFWVEQSITKAISDKGRIVRIPSHKMEDINKIRKAINEYSQKNYKDPSNIELSELTGIPEKTINELLELDQTPIYFDKKVNGDDSDDTDFYNYFSNNDLEEEITEASVKNIQREMINEFIKTLNERDRIVFISRYGLNGEKEKTLEETGKIIGVSRERIRQIEPGLKKKFEIFVKHYRSADNPYLVEYERAGKTDCNEKSIKDIYKSEKQQKKIDRYNKKLQDINKNLTILSLDDTFTNAIIKCQTCGNKWTDKRSRVFTKGYCPLCKLNERNQTYADKVKELNSDLVISNYTGAKESVDVYCKRCNSSFKVKASAFLSLNCRCSTCTKDNKRFLEEINHIMEIYKKCEQFNINENINSIYFYLKPLNHNYGYINKVHNELIINDENLILKTLKFPVFNDRYTDFNINEVMVLMIDNGYLNGNYFSDEAIIKFLNITHDELYKIRNDIYSKFNSEAFDVFKKNYTKIRKK